MLGSGSFDWLCEQGHVGLERVAKAQARSGARRAGVRRARECWRPSSPGLKGDVSVLHAARENLMLAVDLVHRPTGTVVSVDDLSHFTSFRLFALELYPAEGALGFDLDDHMELCRIWSATTDTLGRGLAAKGFGFGGVQRERAYHDALCDLAVPADGSPSADSDRGGRRRRHGRVPPPPRVTRGASSS